MKNILLVKKSEVKIKSFNLDDFTKERTSEIKVKKITKKSLKDLADELGLEYDDKKIAFTKKMMTAYLGRVG